MVSKTKNKNEMTDNILYLQDADAKALGIIEGSAQRVFIDNKEVEVVFVDEHEVVPVSNEDKKIYQEAYKIAAKYLEASSNESSPTWNSLVTENEAARKLSEDDSYDMDSSSRASFKDSWNNFKSLFKKNRRDEDIEVVSNFEYDPSIRQSSSSKNDRSMIRYQNSNYRNQDNYNVNKRHSQHSFRNDVFTQEELEIIQNVIDKAKPYNKKHDDEIKTKKVVSSKSSVKSNKVKSNSKAKSKK